jgi:hypothetical protein
MKTKEKTGNKWVSVLLTMALDLIWKNRDEIVVFVKSVFKKKTSKKEVDKKVINKD